MKLKWLGHSCFQLTLDDGLVIVTDPYDDSVGYPPLRVSADAVLISHDHFDHSYAAAVQGSPRIFNQPWSFELEGVKITGIPSWHDDKNGAKRGPNTIFIVEAEGLRLAHLGDLGHLPDTEEQAAALQGLDAMLIPIGGFYTIDTRQAVEIIRACRPRLAVAMHFANAYCHFSISDESEFVRLTGARRVPNEIEITGASPEGCVVMAC